MVKQQQFLNPIRQLFAVFSALVFFSCTIPAAADNDVLTILPGDKRFKTPEFDDYQATYTSAFSKTGAFTLQARKTGDGKKLTLIDIIPGKESVIVAQRQIDIKTQRLEFSAGPYFAWGAEFVVKQYQPEEYAWSRVAIGDGETKRTAGEFQNKGSISEMFSPLLASLMPMEPGTKFRLPEAYPRKGEFVSSEFDEYEVLRKERLNLGPGLDCECWV
ncbi:MAG: hypothetical protein MJA83_20420, partial [Gammaproteobacteria bacterium]|nr:hypothetical protein [Gammaproteobacteria bacterium]